MILEKKNRLSPVLKESSAKHLSEPSSAPDLLRLFQLGLALYLLLALASYSPSDPSWSTWTSKTDFHNWMGRAGSALSDLLFQAFGLAAFGLVVLLGVRSIRRRLEGEAEQGPERGAESSTRPWIHGALLLLSSSLLLQCVITTNAGFIRHSGGLLGKLLHDGLTDLTGPRGTIFIGIFAMLSSIALIFRVDVVVALTAFWGMTRKGFLQCRDFLEKGFAFPKKAQSAAALKSPVANLEMSGMPILVVPPIPLALSPLHTEPTLFPLPIAPPERDIEIGKLATAKTTAPSSREARPSESRGKAGFTMPSLALLSGKADSKVKPVDRNWYLEKGRILVEKLKDFGVDGEVVNISPGPVITVYEFKPASGVKIKEIANLSDDLTLALSVLSVRIVAPIPGKPVVGIEIPSAHRETVFFKDIVEETPFFSSDVKLPLVLGRLASGEPAIAGLAAMPHLLVAGSTGTGKSVFINTLICSLLFRYSPQQLKLILVDPKMVELSSYEGIPHLLLPVVVDSRKAALALRWAVEEMELRYSLMHRLGVRHVDAYNERLHEVGETEDTPFMPYIVVVIDEYADLMAVVPKDVELSIARLAQKARASGIHLVLATQRPSTDVVTGTIKANFPSRISFRVASSVDSKTILDRAGADRLLGNGDMLFHSAGFTTLKRLQGAFIPDADLDLVVRHLRAQGEPEYDDRLLRAQDEGEFDFSENGSGAEGSADLYDRAVRVVTEKGEASISLIQRHLRIGYNRAASLMEEMEKQGVVGVASRASKRRAVLVNSI